jgi:hypothetical protein
MPGDLGRLVCELRDEVIWAHIKWSEYKELYSERSIPLLNEVSPTYFADLQVTIWESLLLGLCRLTDPPLSGGRPTLTLRRLPDALPDGELKLRVRALVEAAQTATQFAREWRNRRLAHTELPPSLSGQPAQSLPMADRPLVENALASIAATMNAVHAHYEGSETYYEGSLNATGGPGAMLFFLKRGLEVEQEEVAALRCRMQQAAKPDST